MRDADPESGAREARLLQLADMPAYLEARLGGLSAEEAAAPGPDDGFSPVEHDASHRTEIEAWRQSLTR